MEIQFHKYHGTGNDFILIDDRARAFPQDRGLIQGMCDRHFGIGADGLILLSDEKNVDFRMTYFNSDGRESTMCGNGGRCTIAFADFLSLIRPKTVFMAIDGIHEGEILEKQPPRWQVKLKMSTVSGIQRIGMDYYLDTGSPHYVSFQDNIAELDVFSSGRKIRYSERFSANGTNVDFVEKSGDGLFVRSYERGVEGETLSCGTGVTASTLAFAFRNGIPGGTIPVRTLGGQLSVTFRMTGETFDDIWLEGPAARVFTGTYDT